MSHCYLYIGVVIPSPETADGVHAVKIFSCKNIQVIPSYC